MMNQICFIYNFLFQIWINWFFWKTFLWIDYGYCKNYLLFDFWLKDMEFLLSLNFFDFVYDCIIKLFWFRLWLYYNFVLRLIHIIHIYIYLHIIYIKYIYTYTYLLCLYQKNHFIISYHRYVYFASKWSFLILIQLFCWIFIQASDV